MLPKATLIFLRNEYDFKAIEGIPFDLSTLDESEIGDYNNLVWEALASAADTISLCCYPEGRSYDVRAYMHKIAKKSLFDPSFSHVVVRDSNTREMLAVACWYFRTVDKSVGSLRACISTAPR